MNGGILMRTNDMGFTCSNCGSFANVEGRPFCTARQKHIRWHPRMYFCTNYWCTDTGDEEVPFNVTLEMFNGGKRR